MSRVRFLWNFLRNPRQVGSVTPSSRWLCAHLLDRADITNSSCVVEYGPGTACLTREIATRMGEDTTLLAFEVNDEFVRTLRRKAIHPNVRVINDSAERVEDHLRKHGFEGADYIFSGIPFTALPASIREKILRATNDALAPTGKFIAYQYSPYLMKLLRSIFEDVQVSIEPRNIPPAFCFTCSKRT